MTIEALVFDMDGLLLDSERIVQRSWELAGNELGILHMGERIYHTLGMNAASRREYFARAVCADFPHEEFGQKTREHFYRIVEREGLPLKTGAKELLCYAKGKGLKLGLATSSRKEYARRVLEDAGVYDYFDGAVFGDMVSRGKPDPEIYQKACAQLHVLPQNSIAFEDAPGGIRSAHAAGLRPIMIPDLVQPTEEILTLTYRCFSTLAEVIPFLQECK